MWIFISNLNILSKIIQYDFILSFSNCNKKIAVCSIFSNIWKSIFLFSFDTSRYKQDRNSSCYDTHVTSMYNCNYGQLISYSARTCLFLERESSLILTILFVKFLIYEVEHNCRQYSITIVNSQIISDIRIVCTWFSINFLYSSLLLADLFHLLHFFLSHFSFFLYYNFM